MGKGHQKPLKTSYMASQSGWDPHKFVLFLGKTRRRRTILALLQGSPGWSRGGLIFPSYPHIHRLNN